jgi:ribosomal protein S18 acetylase RimI-like enzyme
MPFPISNARVTQSGDAPGILELTKKVNVFSDEEVTTVEELLGEYFTKGAIGSGYYFLTACQEERLTGYACYGPRPLTQAAYDLYWIVTDPDEQKRGIGRMLIQQVMDDICRMGGQLLICETSGREVYLPAQHFYEKNHFQLAAHIQDFYAPGDDLLMYVIHLKKDKLALK